MEQNFSKLPDGLLNKVLSRIKTEEKLAKRRRFVLFSFIFAGSLAAIFPAFNMLREGLSESGFIQFFSLIFSDFEIVSLYWRNFIWALLETLPFAGSAVFLTAVFVSLGSLKFLVRDAKFVLRRA
ncbi:MAG: hypothetical protein WC459_03045 [Patescibacteria group bacterium]